MLEEFSHLKVNLMDLIESSDSKLKPRSTVLWFRLSDRSTDFLLPNVEGIKSLGKAEVFFISVASPVFSENPPKFHQKSQIYRTPLTGGLAKRSAKIKITPIPNSSLIPCFDMYTTLLLTYDNLTNFSFNTYMTPL